MVSDGQPPRAEIDFTDFSGEEDRFDGMLYASLHADSGLNDVRVTLGDDGMDGIPGDLEKWVAVSAGMNGPARACDVNPLESSSDFIRALMLVRTISQISTARHHRVMIEYNSRDRRVLAVNFHRASAPVSEETRKETDFARCYDASADQLH